MSEKGSDELVLEDGSRIAVVGGGPSGSFFSYFALDFAERFGLEIEVDIYEAKDFTCTGPAGCNNCGGLVSESLIQVLSSEGIVLPSKVIRRGIETYTLHLEQGSTVIEAPFNEQRIAAMFRGQGPKGSDDVEHESFDNYLLTLCEKKGARIIRERVTEVERKPDGILLKTKNDQEDKYDLVVGAVGLNKKTFELFNKICPSFRVPKSTKTHICEFNISSEKIDEYFGNSMHVFLLNLPNIKFGALIPKGKYVTLALLGSNVNKEVVDNFLKAEAVRNCFPPEIEPSEVISCQCYPFINVKGAKSEYDDRVVLIGDSSSSKLYKNGIGAAFITARSAAKTAIFQGISKKAFRKHFQPVCDDLELDNNMGKFIFAVTTIIQKSGLLKASMLKMIINEQTKEREQRRMSAVLWDTFTGSASYRSIFRRFLNPLLLKTLTWNIATSLNKIKLRST